MLEILGFMTLAIVSGLAVAGSLAFVRLQREVRDTAVMQRQCSASVNAAVGGRLDALAAELALVPKKAKPGRKPASTGAKRGRPPKSASAPAAPAIPHTGSPAANTEPATEQSTLALVSTPNE